MILFVTKISFLFVFFVIGSTTSRGFEVRAQTLYYPRDSKWELCVKHFNSNKPFTFCSENDSIHSNMNILNEGLIYTIKEERLELSGPQISKEVPSNNLYYFYLTPGLSVSLYSEDDKSQKTLFVSADIEKSTSSNGREDCYVKPWSIRASKDDKRYRTLILITSSSKKRITFQMSYSDHQYAFIVTQEIIEASGNKIILKFQKPENVSVHYLKYLDNYGQLEMKALDENFKINSCSNGCLLLITSEDKNLGALDFSLNTDVNSIELKVIAPKSPTFVNSVETSARSFLKFWTYEFTGESFENDAGDQNKKELAIITNYNLKPYNPSKGQTYVCLRNTSLSKLPTIKADDLQRFSVGEATFDIEKNAIPRDSSLRSFGRLICQSKDSWYYLTIADEPVLKKNSDMFDSAMTKSTEVLIRI
jgi:hypothetical protein